MGFRDLTRRLNNQIKLGIQVAWHGTGTVLLLQTVRERLHRCNSRRRYWEATSGQVRTASRLSNPLEAEIKSVSGATSTVKWAITSKVTGRLTQADRCLPKEAAHIITRPILVIFSRSSTRINRWRSSRIHQEETHNRRTRSSMKWF